MRMGNESFRYRPVSSNRRLTVQRSVTNAMRAANVDFLSVSVARHGSGAYRVIVTRGVRLLKPRE